MPGRPPVNVARVQQLLAQGVKQKAIAERLGINKSTVSAIASGTYLVKEARQ